MCPFFKSERGLRLVCERGNIRFASAEERRRFIRDYCACGSGWEKCSLAISLLESYDDGLR